jgi:hypothetical protein
MLATKALARVIIADLNETDEEPNRWCITTENGDTYASSKGMTGVIEFFLNRVKTDKNTVILVEREG